jgi:type IV secretory pathway component VirB8
MSVERNRWFLISLILGLGLLVSGVTLFGLFPLKRVVPFILNRTENGAMGIATTQVHPYQPDEAIKRYFLAQWVRQLLTLDPHLSSTNLASAYRLTRSKATVEFTDWVQRHQPLAELRKDPTLTRTVSISSISMIDEGAALVRVTTEERNVGNPMALRKKFVLTLHFAVVAPQQETDVLENPAGLLITHFLVNSDLEQ